MNKPRLIISSIKPTFNKDQLLHPKDGLVTLSKTSLRLNAFVEKCLENLSNGIGGFVSYEPFKEERVKE